MPRKQIKPESKLNPNIRQIEFGVREMKPITIYPLSAAFNLDMAEKISDLLVGFFSLDVKKLSEDEVSQRIAGLFIKLVKDNIAEIVEHAVDLAEYREFGIRTVEQLLDDISFDQLTEIAEIVYEVNYKRLVGKVTGFLENKRKMQMEELAQVMTEKKEGKAQVTNKPSDSSAESTAPTESKTSGSPTTKEE